MSKKSSAKRSDSRSRQTAGLKSASVPARSKSTKPRPKATTATAKPSRPAKTKDRTLKGSSMRPSPPTVNAASTIEFIGRGVLLDGSRVLLCQNRKHGYLYLPGGHVDFLESAAQAVEREFLEECGVAVKSGSLALVSEGTFPTKKRWHHEVNLVFHVEPRTALNPKRVKSLEEEIAFIWTELAAVPDLDIRPTAVKAFLATLGGQSQDAIDWVSEISETPLR